MILDNCINIVPILEDRKTKPLSYIAVKSNVNFISFKKVINELEKAGMVFMVNESNKKYAVLTPKGLLLKAHIIEVRRLFQA